MSGSAIATVIVFVFLAAAAVGIWHLWRTQLQLCPHCAWIVRRVQHGWLRCPRCHKQYGRHAKPHLR